MLSNTEKIEEESSESLKKLKKSVYTLLETYSNVHRGTGHNSMITTALFEHARQIILSYLKLDNKNYVVVFCSPRRVSIFKFQLKPSDYLVISSEDYGLPLGIRALAVKKKSLQKCSSIYTGGGMIRHVTSNTVVWADVPERFESGTPSIVNIITLAIAIQLGDFYGKSFSEDLNHQILTPDEILYQDDLMDYSGKELLKKMKKSLVGYKARVPTINGFQHFINLDNAASTPTFLPIWDTYSKTLSQYNKNSQKLILEVKSICSELLGAPLDKYSIIFTSNTTEAINLVAHSLRRSLKKKKDTVIINSELEHHSNELPFRYISNSSLIRISIDDEGFINLNELEDILKQYNEEHKYGIKRVKMVAVCGVSNVLGTYNDLKLISEITHKYNAQLLVDGAQLVAHHKVNINKLDIDYFAFSGHKVYAPFGSGVLIVKKGYLNFNDNELKDIESSGEENLVGIATLGKALFLLNKISMETIEEYEKKLTRLAIKKL
ncbi:MAG: aminotransferase class V-fold PLP-dependent enzyme, partial [Candidatus Thorarchaeota archaeon]